MEKDKIVLLANRCENLAASLRIDGRNVGAVTKAKAADALDAIALDLKEGAGVVVTYKSDDEKEADIAFFKSVGWTWEYPGFHNLDLGPFCATVGYDNGPKRFCVQFVTNDGGAPEADFGADCDTREEVLAAVELFKASAEYFYGKAGFFPVNTGGNCMVLQKDVGEGRYIAVIKDDDLEMPEKATDKVRVALCSEDNHDALIEFVAQDGDEAIKRIQTGALGPLPLGVILVGDEAFSANPRGVK